MEDSKSVVQFVMNPVEFRDYKICLEKDNDGATRKMVYWNHPDNILTNSMIQIENMTTSYPIPVPRSFVGSEFFFMPRSIIVEYQPIMFYNGDELELDTALLAFKKGYIDGVLIDTNERSNGLSINDGNRGNPSSLDLALHVNSVVCVDPKKRKQMREFTWNKLGDWLDKVDEKDFKYAITMQRKIKSLYANYHRETYVGTYKYRSFADQIKCCMEKRKIYGYQDLVVAISEGDVDIIDLLDSDLKLKDTEQSVYENMAYRTWYLPDHRFQLSNNITNRLTFENLDDCKTMIDKLDRAWNRCTIPYDYKPKFGWTVVNFKFYDYLSEEIKKRMAS